LNRCTLRSHRTATIAVWILFRDLHAAYLIGSIALAVTLFDGGLRTDPSDTRRALRPSLALATIGVIVTAAIVIGAEVMAVDGEAENAVIPRRRPLGE
jgi:NhaP-type Na+/H+ and K+/H+ antiporter